MEEMYTVKRNIYKLEKGTKQKSTHWRAKWKRLSRSYDPV